MKMLLSENPFYILLQRIKDDPLKFLGSSSMYKLELYILGYRFGFSNNIHINEKSRREIFGWSDMFNDCLRKQYKELVMPALLHEKIKNQIKNSENANIATIDEDSYNRYFLLLDQWVHQATHEKEVGDYQIFTYTTEDILYMTSFHGVFDNYQGTEFTCSLGYNFRYLLKEDISEGKMIEGSSIKDVDNRVEMLTSGPWIAAPQYFPAPNTLPRKYKKTYDDMKEDSDDFLLLKLQTQKLKKVDTSRWLEIMMNQKSLTGLEIILKGYKKGYHDSCLLTKTVEHKIALNFLQYISDKYNFTFAELCAHLKEKYSEDKAWDKFFEILDEYTDRTGKATSVIDNGVKHPLSMKPYIYEEKISKEDLYEQIFSPVEDKIRVSLGLWNNRDVKFALYGENKLEKIHFVVYYCDLKLPDMKNCCLLK